MKKKRKKKKKRGKGKGKGKGKEEGGLHMIRSAVRELERKKRGVLGVGGVGGGGGAVGWWWYIHESRIRYSTYALYQTL